jgi:hypothetical protein
LTKFEVKIGETLEWIISTAAGAWWLVLHIRALGGCSYSCTKHHHHRRPLKKPCFRIHEVKIHQIWESNKVKFDPRLSAIIWAATAIPDQVIQDSSTPGPELSLVCLPVIHHLLEGCEIS